MYKNDPRHISFEEQPHIGTIKARILSNPTGQHRQTELWSGKRADAPQARMNLAWEIIQEQANFIEVLQARVTELELKVEHLAHNTIEFTEIKEN